jgi:membrane protease YdiL (CAAX protease family)
VSGPYAAHNSFLQRATGANEPWRVVVTVLAVVAGFLFIPDLLGFLLLPATLYSDMATGATRLGLTLQLLGFAVPIFVLHRMLEILHGRSAFSLLGDLDRVTTGLRQALLAVLALLLVEVLLPPWLTAQDIETVRPILPWLIFVPVATLAIGLQCSAEELLFRGYLQQQFGQWSRRPLVWMGGPSLLFGLVHYFNAPGVAEGVLWMVWAGLLGAACADLTARHGTLGPAIGLHLANNLFAFLAFGTSGLPSSGYALFLFPDTGTDMMSHDLAALASGPGLAELATLALAVVVMWLAARIGIRR